MANIQLDIDRICRFRKRANAEFLVPPDRYTILDTSPYLNGQFTKEQLDMRRKTEILKYKGNSSNSLGNNLTRQQLFSLYSSGQYQEETLTYDLDETIREEYDSFLDISFVVKDVVRIPNNVDTTNCGIIYTPTSSSDVPGPVINLYNDPSVPLYNYQRNTAAYGIGYMDQIDKWRLNVENNIIVYNNTDTLTQSLYITERIDTNYTTYEYKVPISLYLYGKRTDAVRDTNTFTGMEISLTTNAYILSVLFDTDTINITPTIVTPTIDKMQFNVNVSDNDISGNVFIGMLSVSDVRIPTESGFIYDFNTSVKIETTFDPTGNLEALYDLSYGIIFNTTENSQSGNGGLTISTIPATSLYEPFSFVSNEN